jgi:hypothetical protein
LVGWFEEGAARTLPWLVAVPDEVASWEIGGASDGGVEVGTAATPRCTAQPPVTTAAPIRIPLRTRSLRRGRFLTPGCCPPRPKVCAICDLDPTSRCTPLIINRQIPNAAGSCWSAAPLLLRFKNPITGGGLPVTCNPASLSSRGKTPGDLNLRSAMDHCAVQLRGISDVRHWSPRKDHHFSAGTGARKLATINAENES